MTPEAVYAAHARASRRCRARSGEAQRLVARANAAPAALARAAAARAARRDRAFPRAAWPRKPARWRPTLRCGRRPRRWPPRFCRCSSAAGSSSARAARAAQRAAPRRGRCGCAARSSSVVREPFGTVLIVGARQLRLDARRRAGAARVDGRQRRHREAGAGQPRCARALRGAARGQPACRRSCWRSRPRRPQTAHALLACGVDKLVFTGSSGAGRELLAAASAHLVPATLELSGWDACIVLDGADLERTADALVFALTLNAGRTCLAPRRVIARRRTFARRSSGSSARLARARRSRSTRGGAARARRRRRAQRRARARGDADQRAQPGPLVLADVTPQMALFGVEVFGARAAALRRAARADVVDWANRTPFALGVTIFGPERRRASSCRSLRPASRSSTTRSCRRRTARCRSRRAAAAASARRAAARACSR